MRRSTRGARAALALVLLTAPLAACSDDDPGSTATTTTTEPASTSTTASPGGTPLPIGMGEVLDAYCVVAPTEPMPTTIEAVFGQPAVREHGPEAGTDPGPVPEADRAPGLEILHAGAIIGGCEDERYLLVIAVLGGRSDPLVVEVAGGAQGDPAAATPDPTAPDGLGTIGGWTHRATIGEDGFVVVTDPSGATLDVPGSAERRDEVFAMRYELTGEGPFDWYVQTLQRTGPDGTPRSWELAGGTVEG